MDVGLEEVHRRQGDYRNYCRGYDGAGGKHGIAHTRDLNRPYHLSTIVYKAPKRRILRDSIHLDK